MESNVPQNFIDGDAEAAIFSDNNRRLIIFQAGQNVFENLDRQ